MAEHDLNEIDLHEGDQRIRLRKGGLPMSAPPMMAMPALTNVATPSTAAPSEPAKPLSHYHEIKSPMVGTFYSKPSPDKEDYVKIGAKVKPDSIVCKLEAMKLFNDLTAECSGIVREVCIQNGQSIDFGTVLFRVELG